MFLCHVQIKSFDETKLFHTQFVSVSMKDIDKQILLMKAHKFIDDNFTQSNVFQIKVDFSKQISNEDDFKKLFGEFSKLIME
jgi:hypothetical protein